MPSIGCMRMGLVLFLGSLVNQGLAQSTPQQVTGSGWQALTKTAPAVATDGVKRYVAWKGASSNKIWFSTFNGSDWTKQKLVGGSVWTAATSTAPALTWHAGQLQPLRLQACLTGNTVTAARADDDRRIT